MVIEPCEPEDEHENMTAFEVGLSEFFACLMVQTILESGIPRDSWALLRQTSLIPSPSTTKESYCLAYDERAADAVEKAIRLADKLTAIISAIKSTEKIIQKAKNPLENEQIYKIAENRAIANIRHRNEMWDEIDTGLDLLLSDKMNTDNPEPNDSVVLQNLSLSIEGGTKQNIGCLLVHGHQLREWIRKQQLFRLPPEVQIVNIGHYHIKMATVRYGLWVIFTGHYKTTLSDKYDLSHIGSPQIRIYPRNMHLQFVIDRSM